MHLTQSRRLFIACTILGLALLGAGGLGACSKTESQPIESASFQMNDGTHFIRVTDVFIEDGHFWLAGLSPQNGGVLFGADAANQHSQVSSKEVRWAAFTGTKDDRVVALDDDHVVLISDDEATMQTLPVDATERVDQAARLGNANTLVIRGGFTMETGSGTKIILINPDEDPPVRPIEVPMTRPRLQRNTDGSIMVYPRVDNENDTMLRITQNDVTGAIEFEETSFDWPDEFVAILGITQSGHPVFTAQRAKWNSVSVNGKALKLPRQMSLSGSWRIAGELLMYDAMESDIAWLNCKTGQKGIFKLPDYGPKKRLYLLVTDDASHVIVNGGKQIWALDVSGDVPQPVDIADIIK